MEYAVDASYDRMNGLSFDATAETADAAIAAINGLMLDRGSDWLASAAYLESIEVGSVYKTKAEAVKLWKGEIAKMGASVAEVWGGWKVTLPTWVTQE